MPFKASDLLGEVATARVQERHGTKLFRDAIWKAHKQGFSMRAIAEAADLSAARVHQIVKERGQT
jgi:hypothetical protein